MHRIVPWAVKCPDSEEKRLAALSFLGIISDRRMTIETF